MNVGHDQPSTRPLMRSVAPDVAAPVVSVPLVVSDPAVPVALFLCLCGVVCGANDPVQIERFGKARREFLEQFRG